MHQTKHQILAVSAQCVAPYDYVVVSGRNLCSSGVARGSLSPCVPACSEPTMICSQHVIGACAGGAERKTTGMRGVADHGWRQLMQPVLAHVGAICSLQSQFLSNDCFDVFARRCMSTALQACCNP